MIDIDTITDEEKTVIKAFANNPKLGVNSILKHKILNAYYATGGKRLKDCDCVLHDMAVYLISKWNDTNKG